MTQEATVPVAIKIMPGHAMICCDITCDTTAATNVGWEKSWETTDTLATKDKLVSETLTSAGEERIAMLCMALSDTTAQKKKISNHRLCHKGYYSRKQELYCLKFSLKSPHLCRSLVPNTVQMITFPLTSIQTSQTSNSNNTGQL